MQLFNLLKAIPVFGQTFDVSLNWIGQLIRGLISGVGVVGVGIILFSLILKLIVLPFDVYQRISMRKQNIKMKEQKDRMEKLQKQYANDKEKYNQKLMEMYKENGISMMSSCLPMILSLVIFIVAINAFNAFSQYSNVQNYNTMVNAYNAQIQSYCPDLKEENVRFEGDKIVVQSQDATDYIYYQVSNQSDETVYSAYNDETHAYIENANNKEYILDVAKIKADAALMAEITPLITGEVNEEQAMYDYFVGKAQDAVVTAYGDTVSENTGFLWIKNIWVTDASYKSPVLDYSGFETEAKREKFRVGDEKVAYSEIGSYTGTQVYTEDAYNVITAKLTQQKEQANGYYILIALSIGTILLQQFVTMRSQKEQQQFSTVDGQGASQQKMTMIIMTGMFAIFSFMYSSAFSIYMVTSNLFSLLSTIIINKSVDVVMAKKEAKEASGKLDNRGLTRIEAAKKAGRSSAQKSQEKKNKNEDKFSENKKDD